MVNWSSPAEIAVDTGVYDKLVFSLFGVYVWELFQTSNFEWSLITRKRKFTWPLINCQALYTFNSWAGNMTILCASTSLMLRTIAIWERQLKVVIPLCTLCLAFWGLLWRGMFVLEAEYSTSAGMCTLTSSNHVLLNINFFMTMCFDLIILGFTMAKLIPHKTQSDLWTLLFRDGLVYFIVTFCFNALPALIPVLDFDKILNIPAATFSAMAACRSVIRLQEFSHSDVYVHSASQIASPAAGGAAARRFTQGRRSLAFARPEVHVTTDQFVMEDFV
ncbi:hypothetical protein WOLCODRAFT_89251 [Wolfiporia cocos MD-104 SS10]|uniref:Uncharacterized protein n=1 Tax=Wolfiporia cocos (strain MD-104) TaxID=742152 RepID=A0A2H3JNC1_WOLCO|nr:hypothetical protein WOLCODRAFT_89251 [Wolfiporia cocos MD-104 SS10]